MHEAVSFPNMYKRLLKPSVQKSAKALNALQIITAVKPKDIHENSNLLCINTAHYFSYTLQSLSISLHLNANYSFRSLFDHLFFSVQLWNFQFYSWIFLKYQNSSFVLILQPLSLFFFLVLDSLNVANKVVILPLKFRSLCYRC